MGAPTWNIHWQNVQVNSGTIDGMIESITSKLNGATITNLPDYLEYTISYEDDVPLAVMLQITVMVFVLQYH